MNDVQHNELTEVLKDALGSNPELLARASAALGTSPDSKQVGVGTRRGSLKERKRHIRVMFTRLHLREQLQNRTA